MDHAHLDRQEHAVIVELKLVLITNGAEHVIIKVFAVPDKREDAAIVARKAALAHANGAAPAQAKDLASLDN